MPLLRLSRTQVRRESLERQAGRNGSQFNLARIIPLLSSSTCCCILRGRRRAKAASFSIHFLGLKLLSDFFQCSISRFLGAWGGRWRTHVLRAVVVEIIGLPLLREVVLLFMVTRENTYYELETSQGLLMVEKDPVGTITRSVSIVTWF